MAIALPLGPRVILRRCGVVVTEGGEGAARPDGEVMGLTIGLNASFFNAHRMLQEYVIHAYQAHGPARDRP